MCGRFLVSYTYKELLSFLQTSFEIEELDIEYKKNYNITPGQPVISVLKTNTKFKVGYINWGFIPSFSSDPKIAYKMINARSESIDSKMSFKDSFEDRRNIILVNGYYEWESTEKGKQPYVIQRNDEKLFAFAGLWTINRNITSKPIYSTTILTKEADDLLSSTHDRMPVILSYEDSIKWLDKNSTKEELFEIIERSNHNEFRKFKVSDYVNTSTNNDAKCIEPI